MLSVVISATCHIVMNKRFLNCLCFLFGALLLVLSVCFALLYERHSCAGVRILSEREYARLSESLETDTYPFLLQNDLPAYIDSDTKTIYVSVDAKELSQPWHFSAVLSADHPEYRLFFAPDTYFGDMETAVRESHSFDLLVVHDGQFVAFPVIFTTLPVLQLTTTYYSEEDYRNHGTLTLRDPYALQNNGYSIALTQAQWHLRGGSSKGTYKPPYKITLNKQDTNENRNLSLLQLGEDDDWILNSMVRDDVKLREMVISNLWNSLQDAENSTLKMSKGEYVEVIIDGSYSGLYMLQRRIDNKYLGNEHSTDVIVKGNYYNTPSSVDTAFRIQFNPNNISSEEILGFLTPYFNAMSQQNAIDQLPNIDIENWIDVNAFISAFHLADNRRYKNMYYVLQQNSNQFTLKFIPWDVDMACGLSWDEPVGFIMDLDQMLKSKPYLRCEAYSLFSLDPTLKSRLAARWQYLRNTTLSFDNIQNAIYSCNYKLVQSGALLRDETKWGLHYDGKDSLDGLLSNLNLHLSRMDDCYQEFN